MDSIFKICKSGTCGVVVSGLEKDNDEYLNEDGEVVVSTREYAYSQTITLNVLSGIRSSGDETIQSSDIVVHTIDCIDESEFEMSIDGLYAITHMIVPTNEWLQYVIDRDPTALTAYHSIYYYDIPSGAFMKYTGSSSEEVTISYLMAVNATPPSSIVEKTTTLIRGDKSTFCICYINDCFYKLCKELLISLTSTCRNKTDDIKSQIYNRDILWMGINVIKYLIELKQFYEAQRVLEDITQCNGLCKSQTKIIGGSGCGCGN